jgi:hypothetical protein
VDSHEEPVMLVTHLSAGGWGPKDEALVRRWVEFWGRRPDAAQGERGAGAVRARGGWDAWPDLIPGRNLTVLLSIAYEHARRRPAWLRWLAPLDRLRLGQRRQRVKRFLDSLELGDAGLNGAVLTELTAVSYTEARQWVQAHASHFCYTQELLAEVRRVYDEFQRDELQMEELARALKKLLEDTRYRKEC